MSCYQACQFIASCSVSARVFPRQFQNTVCSMWADEVSHRPRWDTSFTVWPFYRHEFPIRPTFQGPPCLSRHEFTFLLSLASELGKGNQSRGKVLNALELCRKRGLYSNLTLANISHFLSSNNLNVCTSGVQTHHLPQSSHSSIYPTHVRSPLFSFRGCSIK